MSAISYNSWTGAARLSPSEEQVRWNPCCPNSHLLTHTFAGTTVEVILPVTFSYSTPLCPHTVRVISDELPPSTRFSTVPDLPSPDVSEKTIKFAQSSASSSSQQSTTGSSRGEIATPPSSVSSDGGVARRPLKILAAEDNHIARSAASLAESLPECRSDS